MGPADVSCGSLIYRKVADEMLEAGLMTKFVGKGWQSNLSV